MKRLIERHKRLLTILGVFLLLFINGGISMGMSAEFTGALSMVMAFTAIGYNLVVWFLKKGQHVHFNTSWRRNEGWTLLTALAIVYQIGVFESYSVDETYTFVFIFLLLAIFIIGYAYARRLKTVQKEKGALRKKEIRRILFWYFASGVGAFLITLDQQEHNNRFLHELFAVTGLFYFLALFFFIIRWLIKQIKFILTLKNEKAKAELALLKSQINPHFLFNSLNNLYGLTIEKSDDAPTVVLKLSDMLRYTIYEGQENVVPLKEEINYLQNYIELHKIRHQKSVDIVFDYEIDESIRVAPLLFIILLENAFKHGVERLTENAFIYLDLKTIDQTIIFRIENNFEADLSNQKVGGIGLKNLKERLHLLYPDAHQLSIEKTDQNYCVTLEINTL